MLIDDSTSPSASSPLIVDIDDMELMLDMLPRRCWRVAEQLVGPGTLVRPSPEPAALDGPKLSGGGVAGGQHLRAIVSRFQSEAVDSELKRRPQHGLHVDAQGEGC